MQLAKRFVSRLLSRNDALRFWIRDIMPSRLLAERDAAPLSSDVFDGRADPVRLCIPCAHRAATSRRS